MVHSRSFPSACCLCSWPFLSPKHFAIQEKNASAPPILSFESRPLWIPPVTPRRYPSQSLPIDPSPLPVAVALPMAITWPRASAWEVAHDCSAAHRTRLRCHLLGCSYIFVAHGAIQHTQQWAEALRDFWRTKVSCLPSRHGGI